MNEWAWLVIAVGLILALGLALRARRAGERVAAAERRAAYFQREYDAAAADAEALKRRLARLETATRDAVLTVNGQRHIVGANQNAQALLGTLAGRSLIEGLRDADLNSAVGETLADGKRRSLKVALGARAYEASIVNGGGEVVVALHDITELTRLQRARRDFVANISHELRTPLTSLGLLCDALQASAEATEIRPLVDTIATEVTALTHLVTDMLDLTQIEDGRVLVKLERVAAQALVETAVGRLRPQAQQRSVQLIVDVETDLTVLADFDKAARVLTNLLDNAVKYSPPDGVVRVNARRVQSRGDGADAEFVVVDQGPGIAAADLPRVFERFFKVDRARERGGGMGAGLGLAIARHLVEAQGGRIWAASVEGHGATFTFTLPAA